MKCCRNRQLFGYVPQNTIRLYESSSITAFLAAREVRMHLCAAISTAAAQFHLIQFDEPKVQKIKHLN